MQRWFLSYNSQDLALMSGLETALRRRQPATEIFFAPKALRAGGYWPAELWRHTAPYRGLAAMTEADSDFFFGRTPETLAVLRTIETAPNRLPVLLGNSGVGKSSLAQAGVLAALKRQAWPEGTVA